MPIPTVFISSTVKEFRDLRSAIAYILRGQGFRVYQSEDAGFDIRGDRSAVEECFANILNCDYYILLVGNTRGNLYEDEISITRKEYRVARDAFLTTGRPRLFLYLLETAETALTGSKKVQTDAGIDSPEHLASFIAEIQRPGIENAPNFLSRFRNFEQVIDSLAIKMNLGRTLSEKIIRHSLVSELLSNLTHMVERRGTSAFPKHGSMHVTRENLQITTDDLDRSVTITDDQVISFALSLIGRTTGDNLRTRAMEDALDSGAFLEFNPVDGMLQESALHRLLQQTFEDVQHLRNNDASAKGEWDKNIVTAISTRWHGRPNSLELLGFDLALALAYYDLMENIFQEHLAICRVLLGISEQLPPCQRQPLTPLGEQEQRRMHAERVSPLEVSKLIKNNVWPFGTKVPKEVYGKTHDEQVKNVTEDMHAILTNLGIDGKEYMDILERAAENYIKTHAPKPEECLEDRRKAK